MNVITETTRIIYADALSAFSMGFFVMY
jgi:hypothetical protein